MLQPACATRPAILVGIAPGYLRDHPERLRRQTPRQITEADLVAAEPAAKMGFHFFLNAARGLVCSTTFHFVWRRDEIRLDFNPCVAQLMTETRKLDKVARFVKLAP